MGLSCLALGHDFGDPEHEYDRDEHGAEVVSTRREIETCRRCETTRTVSVSREVVSEPDETVSNTPERMTATTATMANGDDPKAGPVVDRAGGIDGPSESKTDETNDTGPIEFAAGVLEGDGRSATTREENGSTDHDPPRTDSDAPTANEGGTDDYGTDGEGVTHETGGTDVRIQDERKTDVRTPDEGETSGDSTNGDRSPNTSMDDIDRIESSTGRSSTGRSADNSGRAPGEWPARDDERNGGSSRSDPSIEWPEMDESDSTTESELPPDAGVFECPACGFSARVAASPLRDGDSCPECQRGYLARRTRKG